MVSKQQEMWAAAAEEASDLFGGSAEGGRNPSLSATVGGFPIEARLVALDQGGHKPGCSYVLTLPGWPAATGLNLRSNWPRARFRSRYVWFDDPDWDDFFKVKAKDPGTVRIQLTRERRAAFKKWIESHCHEGGLLGPVIEEGQFKATRVGLITESEVMSSDIRGLVELGRILTQ